MFPELRGMIERSREIFASGESHQKDSYNESLHIWRLRDGRMVEFGSLQHEKDKESYRGRPHDLYAWDEVTEIGGATFRFVNAWNRTTIRGQRCRVVATFNPPTTPEAQWVIDYLAPWLDPAHPNPAIPGELRWFATVGGEDIECAGCEPFEHADKITRKMEIIKPRSRTFIPAKLEDNPILEATGYRAVLQGLPEPLRSQMLFGDFSAGTTDDAWQVVPSAWVDAAQARWTPEKPEGALMSALGVDVARGGRDNTTLGPRYGTWFAPVLKYPGEDTPDGPAVAALVKINWRSPAKINMDVIGVGAAAYDACKANGLPVVALNGANSSSGTDRSKQLSFRNKRAEWHWKFREMLDPQYGENIMLPPDRELKADLCAPRWKLTVSGIQVEEKEEIKKRIGRSPDVGEAVIYASAIERGGRDPGDYGAF